MKSIRSIAGTPRRRNGVWSSVTVADDAGRERALGADAPRPPRAGASTARVRARLARDPHRALLGDEVEQDERADLLGVALGVRPSSRAGRSPRRPRVVRGLLAVEEHEADLGGAPLGRLALRSARAISSTAAVPPAPSLAPTKPGQVLRVVVRGERRSRACAAGDAADDVAQARVAGHGLDAPAREPLAQAVGELARAAASPPGAARARPGARGPPTRARESKRSTRFAVAAAGVALRSSAPEPPPAASASTSATTIRAGTR